MPLEAGTRIGPYVIQGVLGAGGMGEVYRAHDARLDRDVAVKILPAGSEADGVALERFNLEARVIASVNHPHICTVYDVGEHQGSPYLVMELLDGSTLDTRIGNMGVPVEQLVEWGIQLADALDAAHARGIVHRDLKPANIMVTTRGVVKILDFGVAKLVGTGTPWSAQTATALTHAGMTVGTVAYMAPEQVRGDVLDHRADLFALGVVLYEMATGRRAFRGPTTGMILDGILNRPPAALPSVNPALPAAVVVIIEKLLEKDRELRYQRAADLRTDLKRALRELGAGAATHSSEPGAAPAWQSGELPSTTAAPQSVAVLPFRSLSTEADNAIFSEGITEDLIDALGRIGGLRVASRASAFRFRDSADRLQDVSAALGVNAIVEGSVRRSGTRLRVSAELVDTATGFQRWSGKYDRQMADVFEIQDEIVSALVTALAPALLGGAAHVVRRPTDNLEAYEYYLKGRHYWHQRSPSTLRLAIQSFEQAIALDEDYALAYAGLADSWALYRPYGWLPMEACRPPAQRAIARAMALGPDLAEVQFAQALHLLYFDPHWRHAAPHFARAIELNPRWSLARAFHGVFLAGMYRADDAKLEGGTAVELDPLSPFIVGAAGMIAFAVGDAVAAERDARRALELQPDFLLGMWLLALALDLLDRLEEAEEVMTRATAASRAPIFLAILAKILARRGRMTECAHIEAELEDRRVRGEYIPRGCEVIIETGRGDVPRLRSALRAALDEQVNWFTIRMGPGPHLERFRSDPQIDAMLSELYDAPSAPPEQG